MKTLTAILVLFFLSTSFSKANDIIVPKKTFNKKDILRLSDAYVNNNVNVHNPAIIDVDNDGDFDILNFTEGGKVEYYKNIGTLEQPFFILENKNFDNYEVNSFLPSGMPVPIFFADGDGDKDVDVFGIIKDGYDSKTHLEKYKTVYVENIADLDQYTLITIILVLVIVALLVLILR